MTLELSTEEKIIVTVLWAFTIFFLLLVSGIFEGGHEPIKPPNIPPPPPPSRPHPLLFRRRLRVRTKKRRRYVLRSKTIDVSHVSPFGNKIMLFRRKDCIFVSFDDRARVEECNLDFKKVEIEGY